MNWWSRLTTLRRIVLVVLVVTLLGTVGALIWDYPFWPFTFLGCAAVIVNFVLIVRDGLRSPVEGRSDLDR